ncbi:hypothetical protein FAI40_06550 [Acetobacteraceae bacterium]|nr:hypothetical protein FAI40_06550 [Acetobacteraceae bacterium]
MKKVFGKRFFKAALVVSLIWPITLTKVQAEQKGVVDEWYAHLTMDLMLGAKLEAAAIYEKRVPWLFYFYPALSKLTRVPATGFNPEQIITMNPKYVVLPITFKAQAETLQHAHIQASVLDFKDMAGLLACVDESAKLENTSVAFQKAEAYRAFVTEIVGAEVLEKEKKALLNENRLRHFSFFSKKDQSDRKRILHISSLNPLTVDGKETIIDEWISLAGGQNVVEAKGNNHPVTWEQVFASNPDVIILGSGSGSWEKGTVPKGAEFLPAIQSGHLYRNPTGIFLWDRYGLELPLQILWAKNILAGKNPDNLEMREKMKEFYGRFFDLHPSEEVLGQILKGETPH